MTDTCVSSTHVKLQNFKCSKNFITSVYLTQLQSKFFMQCFLQLPFTALLLITMMMVHTLPVYSVCDRWTTRTYQAKAMRYFDIVSHEKFSQTLKKIYNKNKTVGYYNTVCS